jgi:hypothetical protein
VRRPVAGRSNVPAVRVREQIDQPILVNGHPVSFWQTVTGGEPTPTHADLARLLVMFHAAGDCPCDLVTFEPLRTSQSRLAKAAGVTPADRDFLAARCTDLTEQFGSLDFALQQGLTVGAVIVLGAIVSLALYVRQRREPLLHRSPSQRSRWTPVPEDPDS